MTPDALDYITIQGFKSIASIEKLPLRPINVVIGPNGSGKSNFVGAFSFLHAIREGRLREYVAAHGGADRVLHFGSKTTREINLELSFEHQTNGYQIRLGPTSDDRLAPLGETVWYWDKKRYPERPFNETLFSSAVEAGISSARSRVGTWVNQRLGGWRLYHLHDTSASSPMRKTAKLHDNRFLRADGANLAAFLYYLREAHQDAYALIRGTVQRVAPFFEDFQLEPLRLAPEDIQLEWRHRNSDRYFDAAAFSDGTLRFIALAALFLQPRELRPSVILVDEPELGLHPYAIEVLAALIDQASRTTQVIVSTQSSLLLDHFRPEDVLVAERIDGGTALRRLDPGELTPWLADFSLGQLWEKNELGGRPGPE